MRSMLGYMKQKNKDKVLEGDSPQASAAGNLDEQVGLPSASSSSETARNIINALCEEAKTAERDLDAIIQRISKILDAIKIQKESQKKTERSKESQKKTYWPTSAGFLKVKDFLLEAVNTISSLKDVLPAHAAKEVARDVIQGLGQAHWVTSGFLLIVYILDRFETLSSNQERCLSLLDEMYQLAVDVRELERCRKGLAEAERPDDLAEVGTALIVNGSLICFNQMGRKNHSRIFSTSKDQDDLINFKGQFKDFHDRMLRRMSTWICSSLFCKTAPRLRPRENAYPDQAVGIEEPFNNVTELLQCESEERAVAVIVHGFGGIGKTTLADAVFARCYVKDGKYSVVRLDPSRDIGNSEIVELQKNILKDLRGTEGGRTSQGTEGDEMVDFSDWQDGRRQIGELLRKVVAFLYIDNVLDSESFEKLLPTRRLKDAKKLRLLITTRNKNVLNQSWKIKREVHEMQPLPNDQRKSFLMEEMRNGPDDIHRQISDSDVDKIVAISGGVPKLLELMIRFILSEPDKIRESYDRVIEDSEKFTGDAFNDIDKYIFAYDGLPPECKNPFLDICYFFKGWEWETVANIVGGSELNQLERRALVSKDEDMISLHDVILRMGKAKAQDTRFDFTGETAGQIDEFFEKDTESLELVKGLWFGDDEACKIPITKLNSMHNSLRVFGHKMQQEESFEKMELGEGQREPIFHELLVYKGESPHCPFKWSWLKKLRFLSYRPQNLEVLHKIPSKNLKHIELDGSLCSVRQISLIDIQQLRVLQVLRLINFQNLEKLPEEWGDYLRKNLKELTLSNCTAMKQLPGSISQLTSLKILKLDNCCNLEQWPEGCESLSSSLQELNMLNCRKLKSLPSCFAEALDSDSRRFFQDEGILPDSPQSDSDSPPAAKGQTVSDEEQVGLPSASPSTEMVSKKEQVGLPSASPSSQTVSNLINAIREDSETVKPELDALIHKIYGLFVVIKTPKELQKETKRPISAGFSKSKDLLLERVRVICSQKDGLPAHEASQTSRDVVQGLSQVAHHVVKGLGQAHWVTSCFLLVSYILDIFETLSSNQEGCLSLLEQMYYLAVDIKGLKAQEDLAKAGTELIVEGSLMCCTQIDRSEFRMVFTTSVDAKKILDFKEKLVIFNANMVRKMVTSISCSLLCNNVRPAVHREDSYSKYAVGIEEPFNSVAKLLQWESEERAVAVIVHGFGGIGKTTLADAVFARYFVKDCKYSVVRLDSSPERKPEIVKLQKYILKDLMRRTESGRESKVIEEGNKILDFNDVVAGRAKIGELLKKERAFIYIDNVVNPESLKELLVSPKLEAARKLRLLITTRDIHAVPPLGKMKREVHEMQPLSHDQGKSLLIKKIYNGQDDNNEQITDRELNEIVNISGGIPRILDMISRTIQCAKDKRKACRIVKEDSEKLTGYTFHGIDELIFAYDDLPDDCKNPFLDICFFLKGWKWETVANIVGESQLEVLEKRALVSKDENMNVRLHDIILKIGKEKARDGEVKARDTRIDFTNAPAQEIEEFFEKDMKYLQLIKGLWFSDQACNIPVTKLNSMKDSLRIFGHKMVLENGQCENRFSKLLVYKGETPHSPFKWSRLTNLKFLSCQPQNLNLLKEIPSSNIKHIELDGSLCSDREILSSNIKELKTLQVLKLINFPNLEKLPEEWGTDLRENLKELTLSNCTAMKQLTGSISQLTGLQILELDNCCNLEQWPEGCESLSFSLKKIILCNCPILRSLPSCFVEALEVRNN